MPVEIRSRRQGQVTELYLTARPGVSLDTADLFGPIAALLRGADARILHERIFLQSDDLERPASERRTAYGELDDGVTPTWLLSPAGRHGPLSAVMIHAVAGTDVPLACGAHARVLRHEGASLATLSGLAASTSGTADPEFTAAAEAVFAHASDLLRRCGSTLGHLARTWLWVDPIEEHYADLNRVRTRCFVDAGLIREGGVPPHLPASTGIGLRPAGPPSGSLGLEAIAAVDGPVPITWLAAGNQTSAFAYGSAFSRAARLRTPTGDTVYLSGTASIDGHGRTVAPGDVEGQVRVTVENVRAALHDLGLSERDIAQGVVYAPSVAGLEAWHRQGIRWPLAEVLADICRPDLLFEVEVTVCPGATAV